MNPTYIINIVNTQEGHAGDRFTFYNQQITPKVTRFLYELNYYRRNNS